MKVLVNLETAQQNTINDTAIANTFPLELVLVQWVHQQPEQVYLADPAKALYSPMVFVSTNRDHIGPGEEQLYTLQWFHPFSNESLTLTINTDLRVIDAKSKDPNFEHGDLDHRVEFPGMGLRNYVSRVARKYPHEVNPEWIRDPATILSRHTFPSELMAFN